METGTDTVSRTSQTGCEQGSGGENRRQSSRPVADCALARSHHRFAKCLLCPARASTHGRAVLAQSAEPPYADPHVRWCGRGGGATRPPMPISPQFLLLRIREEGCAVKVNGRGTPPPARSGCQRNLEVTIFKTKDLRAAKMLLVATLADTTMFTRSDRRVKVGRHKRHRRVVENIAVRREKTP